MRRSDVLSNESTREPACRSPVESTRESVREVLTGSGKHVERRLMQERATPTVDEPGRPAAPGRASARLVREKSAAREARERSGRPSS
eukprot:3187985-Prymnesium_polylepis.1